MATKENGEQINILYNRFSTHCTLKLRQSHLFKLFCKINLLRNPNGGTQFKYTLSTAYMHSWLPLVIDGYTQNFVTHRVGRIMAVLHRYCLVTVQYCRVI